MLCSVVWVSFSGRRSQIRSSASKLFLVLISSDYTEIFKSVNILDVIR